MEFYVWKDRRFAMSMLLSTGKQRRKGGMESGHEFDLSYPRFVGCVSSYPPSSCDNPRMSQSIALRKFGLFSQLHNQTSVQEYVGIMMA